MYLKVWFELDLRDSQRELPEGPKGRSFYMPLHLLGTDLSGCRVHSLACFFILLRNCLRRKGSLQPQGTGSETRLAFGPVSWERIIRAERHFNLL